LKVKLEEKLLRTLRPGDYYDTVRRRLVLRIRPDSRKYVIRYRLNGAPPRRFTIGDANVLSLARAREQARERLADVDKGIDPHEVRRAEREAAERRRAGETVSRAIASWLRDGKLGPAAKWKGKLGGGSARSFLPHVRRFRRELGARRLADLTPRAIERFVVAGAAPATRNRALTALRIFLRWAVRKGLVPADPSAGIGKEREPERARVLSDAELRELIRGFDATRYGPAVRLLALTGLRRDEALGAEWSWFDASASTLTIPPEAEKTGRSRGEPRRVALSPQATALLTGQRQRLLAEGLRSSRFIFPTSSGERPHRDALKPVLYRLRGRRSNGRPASKDKRAKPRTQSLRDDVTIHDVRRTVADALLNRLGSAPWVVDHVVLGHVRPKLLRTYMPTLPLDEARGALTRWAEVLDRVVAASVEDAR
jgi:integrase